MCDPVAVIIVGITRSLLTVSCPLLSFQPFSLVTWEPGGEHTWPACAGATCEYCSSNGKIWTYGGHGGGRTHKMFFLVRPLHARLVIFFPRKPMHSFMELVWRNILNYRIHYVQKINWTWYFQYEIFFIFLQETLKDQLPPWICRFPIIDIKSRLTSDVMRSDNNVMREQCNDWSWAW